MKDANYAPMYCALYPGLAKIARAHGYALAVHGTLGRDMDLICIPWVDEPSEPEEVVTAITTEFHIRLAGGPPTIKPHGREAWTITVGFGECFIDLSFMPRKAALVSESGLHPDAARDAARTARMFLIRFAGEDFGEFAEAGPHDRRHLATALDHLEELGAMVLNLADRVESKPDGVFVPIGAGLGAGGKGLKAK